MQNRNSKFSIKARIKKSKRRKWYYTVSLTMAAIVVFCTVYALILPAITMEKEQKALDCSLSVHQHTEQCYDSAKKLICGEADFVVHTHNDDCYDINRNLTCKISEVLEHNHKNSCYDKKGNLTCKLPEVELHKHNDSCYDKDGTLICGKLQTTKHIHGTACFKTVKSTDDEALKSAIKPVSKKNAAANSGEGWGYNDDGSIYWSDLTFKQITSVQKDTPYTIMGNAGVKFLTGNERVETSNGKEYTYIEAVRKENVQKENYADYQHWYFESADSGKYYIYYQNEADAAASVKHYMMFTSLAAHLYVSQGGKQIALTEDVSLATAFTVQECTEAAYSGYMTIGAEITDSNGTSQMYYLNICGGDSDKRYSWWFAFPKYEAGCYLRVGTFNNTANKMDTVSSPNTVINLFDYWTNPDGRYASDVNKNYDGGINSGHPFKFHWTDPVTTGMNAGTHASKTVPGIVAKQLKNGFPVLSGTDVTYNSSESLDYLFDPNIEADGKVSYRNVGGLLRVNRDGYYYYNSHETMAEFDETSNNITVYDHPGIYPNNSANRFGEFFPFNRAPEVALDSANDASINHYIGMTITTRFIQQHGGYTEMEKKTPTTFYFSGDDDVWIFVDGVLVGDIGGKHTEVKVEIDFSTGDVLINGKKNTTLLQAYKDAGAENKTQWIGNTYKDNTTHTLKFFYLERGNHDSNLTLQYNLTEIPRTAIKKTNEYGAAVPGAKFAVYAAEADSSNNYYMLNEKGGQRVQNLPDEIKYDANGNIVDSAGNILVNALYVGTTDSKGEMVFVDHDSMYYTINELNDLFGDNFILRELEVPKGYRMVAKDINLQVFKGANQKILRCDNSADSGTRAATNLQVTATDIIHLRRNYTGEGEFNGKTAIQYCDPDTGEPFGTLFSVVLKYIGPIDENGNVKEEDLSVDSYWTPVYGSDAKGYKLVDRSDGKSIVAAAIEAAKEGQKYGDVAFSLSPSNSTMKLTMENLPGHITKYYRMLGENDKGKTRYTVGYYWTDAKSVDKAIPDNITTENTYGVNSNASTIDGIQYSGFERVFGAEINIPNLINDLYVQKVDSKNTLINGATFALYQVQQADNGEIRYLAKAADGSTSYIPLPENAKPDKVTGNITAGDKTIEPLDTDVTHDFDDGIHKGSVKFDHFDVGQYIIKEIKAPPGYNLNTSDIMVLVTNETIYANAGTEDDGITVGRGPGYVVSTLNNYASQGEIDNTLTWVYAQMRISGVSDRFADVGKEGKILGYLTENYSCKTGTESEAARSYLEYSNDKTDTPFNYVANDNRTVENGAQNPLGTRRLFTTVGWPYYEVHQDSSYGKEQAKKVGANYEDASEADITNLFSRSTYIRVTDMNDVTLKIKKVDSTSKDVLLSGAQFRLFRFNDGNQKEYYVKDSKNNVSWNTDVNTAFVVTTGKDGMSDNSFTKLTDGTFYLEEIKAPSGYNCSSEPIVLNIKLSRITFNAPSASTVDEVFDDASNLYTDTVTITNSTGFELPATGGSGTMIFYIVGGIFIVDAGVLLVMRKRMRAKTKYK